MIRPVRVCGLSSGNKIILYLLAGRHQQDLVSHFVWPAIRDRAVCQPARLLFSRLSLFLPIPLSSKRPRSDSMLLNHTTECGQSARLANGGRKLYRIPASQLQGPRPHSGIHTCVLRRASITHTTSLWIRQIQSHLLRARRGRASKSWKRFSLLRKKLGWRARLTSQLTRAIQRCGAFSHS